MTLRLTLRRIIYNLALLFVGCIIVKLLINFNVNHDVKYVVSKISSVKGISTESCPIPDFPKLSQFFKPLLNLNEFKCDKYQQKKLVSIENGYLHLMKPLNCNYQCVYRVNDFKVKLDNPKPLKDHIKVPCSYFVVNCKSSSKTMMQYVYTAHIDDALIDQASKKKINKTDVWIIGVDSMSRRAWKFYLPKTYAMFHDKLGAVSFNKFNIVGDGTTANLQVLLTGTKDTETIETRRRISGAKFVDEYNWIWKEFKAHNYVTMYQEDVTDYGTFQYRLRGFDKKPVDFFSRVGLMYAEKNKFIKGWCLGDELYEVVQIKMLRDFSKLYSNANTFVFSFFGYMSHYQNRYVNALDDELSQFVEEQRRLFPDKLIILHSDHGHRYYNREHLEGNFEERLPYLGILLPKNKLKKYEKTLRENKDVLITGLDVHATLRHILYDKPPQHPSASILIKNIPKSLLKSRYQSLLTELPKNRSCEDVDLPAHWCSCLKMVPVSVNSYIVTNVAQQAVAQITSWTEPWRHLCAPLKLHKVISAFNMLAHPSVLAFKQSKDHDGYVADLSGTTKRNKTTLRLTLIANPGSGKFEVSVSFEQNNRNIVIDKINFREVGRLNVYAPFVKCLTPQALLTRRKSSIVNQTQDEISDIRKFCICNNSI